VTTQGFVRLRKHQFARQSVFGTKVAAVRAYPFKGVPDSNLNWTDPDIDAGSLVVVAAPHREAPDLTAPLTDPSLRYNNLPLYHAGFFGGAITPTGGPAYAWAYAPAAAAPLDDLDLFTYEFGDDVTTDWFQFGDCVLESVEFSGPEGLGALTVSATWRNGSIASSGSTDSPDSPVVPTAGLDVAVNDAIVYLKDASIYISSNTYDLGYADTKISDALHSFTMRWTQELDQKRWANGDQKFDIDAYGRSTVMVELECTFAKTTDTVGIGSESDAWMSDDAVNRYVQIAFESSVDADTGVPYSWTPAMPMRYYTRTEGEVGGNTVIVLTGHAFYDPDNFGGYFTSDFVNTLAAASL
jgi:hypothetical protein